MHIAIKILIAIVGVVIISQFIQPLLVDLYPPLGVIALIALYIMVVAYVLGWIKIPPVN